jgi:hypothetical protein
MGLKQKLSPNVAQTSFISGKYVTISSLITNAVTGKIDVQQVPIP